MNILIFSYNKEDVKKYINVTSTAPVEIKKNYKRCNNYHHVIRK